MAQNTDPASISPENEDHSREPPPKIEPAISYIKPNKMVTRSLEEWAEGISHHQEKLSDWVVTKIEHLKNFHFSAVLHECLRVSVTRRKETTVQTTDNEEVVIFVDRMAECDQVTVGWILVEHPPLTAWWIVRLFRGYFSDPVQGGVPVLTSSVGSVASAVELWRAKGYSACDYLCSLKFRKGGIPLLEFSGILKEVNQEAPVYDAVKNNCFWYARRVYQRAQERWQHEEDRGVYYKHRGKFAGMKVQLAVVIARILSIQNPDTKELKKK